MANINFVVSQNLSRIRILQRLQNAGKISGRRFRDAVFSN